MIGGENVDGMKEGRHDWSGRGRNLGTGVGTELHGSCEAMHGICVCYVISQLH